MELRYRSVKLLHGARGCHRVILSELRYLGYRVNAQPNEATESREDARHLLGFALVKFGLIVQTPLIQQRFVITLRQAYSVISADCAPTVSHRYLPVCTLL